MKISVVTTVAGRHAHLTRQLGGFARSTVTPHEHIVVSMGDKVIPDLIDSACSSARCVALDHVGGSLPLARARNLGAERALRGGADVLVFLDVDCIPDAALLETYRSAASEHETSLLCGPVTYLSGGDSAADYHVLPSLRDPHPARPNPAVGAVERGENFDLFWSLSFAVDADTWRTIGGFCEDYTGYGGEDTDFAAIARTRGVGLRWVGGAHAYHQHHSVSDPPTEHLADIVTNARLFHSRWGRWPMTGWLESFERLGLIARDRSGAISTQAPIAEAITGHD